MTPLRIRDIINKKSRWRNPMSVENNKKVATADVLCIGPVTLKEKLAHYSNDAVVWDPVMRVAGYAETNTASGFDEVKKFFTWLANLPPVEARVQNVFGEGDHIAVEWVLLGNQNAHKLEIPCVNIYEFKDGKIKSVRMHFDSAFFADITNRK
jgi:ketosteroid isomerase-like protein